MPISLLNLSSENIIAMSKQRQVNRFYFFIYHKRPGYIESTWANNHYSDIFKAFKATKTKKPIVEEYLNAISQNIE